MSERLDLAPLDGEHLSRVQLMADGDPTWDLSDNDCAALKSLIAAAREREALRGRVAELDAAVDRGMDVADGLSLDAALTESRVEQLSIWQKQQMERCQEIGKRHVLQNWEQFAPAAICQSLSRELAVSESRCAELTAQLTESQKDTERLDWLTEEVVNIIDLDDGRIIDVRGLSVRKAIDAARAQQGGEA